MVTDKLIPKSNIVYYKDILEFPPWQTVIVPNAGEHPLAVQNTIKSIALANAWAHDHGLKDERKGFNYIDEIILSDQSPKKRFKENQGKIYTAKDVVEREAGRQIPRIYHLPFDKELDEILMDYIQDEGFRYHMKQRKPRGKGFNMYISSLATGTRSDDNVFLMFLDAENEQIGPDHVLALAKPILNTKYKFIKSAFDRFHMEGGERHLGGRICAAVGVPITDMLYEGGLIKSSLYYPLSGEINIVKSILQRLIMPRAYGVEEGMNIQLLLNELGILDPEEFLQVYLRLNMDQPLGEGKPKEIIYEKCASMTQDIALTTFGLIGEEIVNTWKTPKEFISDFGKHQDESIKLWLRRGRGAAITGGLDAEELKKRTKKMIYSVAKGYYLRKISKIELNKEFILPVYNLKELLGEVVFDRLVGDLTSKRSEIK